MNITAIIYAVAVFLVVILLLVAILLIAKRYLVSSGNVKVEVCSTNSVKPAFTSPLPAAVRARAVSVSAKSSPEAARSCLPRPYISPASSRKKAGVWVAKSK